MGMGPNISYLYQLLYVTFQQTLMHVLYLLLSSFLSHPPPPKKTTKKTTTNKTKPIFTNMLLHFDVNEVIK